MTTGKMDRATYQALILAHQVYSENLVRTLTSLGVEENTTDMIRTELYSTEYIMKICIEAEE